MIEIFAGVILPVFLMIGTGTLLDRCFTLDLATLSKLNFHIFVPALVFVKLQESTVRDSLLLSVAGLVLAHLVLLFVLASIVFSRRWYPRSSATPKLGVMFYNAGNFGIPLAEIAFGANGAAIMAVVLMVQNLVSFTFGVGLISNAQPSRRKDLKAAALALLKVPVLWAVVLGLALPSIGGPVSTAMVYLGNGLIPLALITLGIQLSRCNFRRDAGTVSLVVLLRLLVSPALVLGLSFLWPWDLAGNLPILLLAGGLPVAVNTYILALEYQHDEDLAARQIFWTTLLSGVTLTILLGLIDR